MAVRGGYEECYDKCSCFWGREPGSLVRRLAGLLPSMEGMKVLDAGCGEGKNAAFFAQQGAHVLAVDVCEQAIANARREWGDKLPMELRCAELRDIVLEEAVFDIVIAYGLMHCLEDEATVSATIERLQRATKQHGWNIICTFNSRYQELDAHPGFRPTLLPHQFFVSRYDRWRVVEATDLDLRETHPHNGIEHVHSMTRILAQWDPHARTC